jgi:phosphopantetheinyl transferase (holo-ACP synthase)
LSERATVFRELSFVTQVAGIYSVKEFFSKMKNIHAQKEVTKILQNLDIENNKIRCTDGSALQALIAYVKRFLQLLHQVKENLKRTLTSHEIVNSFISG